MRQIISASSLAGHPVCNAAGETLGEIRDLMLDVESGQIAYAVLSLGASPAMGNRLFVVPIESMHADGAQGRYVLDGEWTPLEEKPELSPAGRDPCAAAAAK